MRILATLALVGVLAVFCSNVAIAQSYEASNQIAEQKLNTESNTIENSIVTINHNFIASGYISEIDPAKVKRATRLTKRVVIDYSKLPQGEFTINASAYTAAADECGKSDGITASGKKVTENRTLACPPAYAFGTKIEIDGMGIYTCEDRGGAIKGNHFDIYMKTKNQAFAFGRKNLIAKVVK